MKTKTLENKFIIVLLSCEKFESIWWLRFDTNTKEIGSFVITIFFSKTYRNILETGLATILMQVFEFTC